MPASLTQKPLLAKIRLTSTIEVKTGLHIGGGGDNLDIGGLDKPVIRDPLTKHPYLPGSSIKGKMRPILERVKNKPLNRHGGSGVYRYESDDLENGYTLVDNLEIPFEGAKTCPISRLFGSTGTDCYIKQSVAQQQGLDGTDSRTFKDESETFVKIKGRNAPARLIVRDSHLTPESAEKLKKVDTGLFMTEWKFENGIDRVTAAANPRQVERVPAGSIFNFELVYTVEDPTQVVEDLKNIAVVLAILEDDALGGHGSRGYGHINFGKFRSDYRDLKQYQRIETKADKLIDANPQQFTGTQNLLQQFETLSEDIQNRLREGDS